jgi:hypothetical protein
MYSTVPLPSLPVDAICCLTSSLPRIQSGSVRSGVEHHGR